MLMVPPLCIVCCCTDQSFQPNGDSSVGNWEDSTGGDNDGILYEEINEPVASDAEFIRDLASVNAVTWFTTNCILDMPDGTGRGADFQKATFAFRARYQTAASPSLHRMFLRFIRHGFQTVASVSQSLTTSFASYSVDDITLGNFDLDNLTLEIQGESDVENVAFDLSWIEVTLICR